MLYYFKSPLNSSEEIFSSYKILKNDKVMKEFKDGLVSIQKLLLGLF